MSANGTIKTRCPVCRAKYRVSTDAVGHRAHCNKCDTTFRVEKLITRNKHNPYIPTEEDIVKWLNEGEDKTDLAVRPRIIDGATAKPVVEADKKIKKDVSSELPDEPAAPLPADRKLKPPEADRVLQPSETDSVLQPPEDDSQLQPPKSDRLIKPPETDIPAKEPSLRKTG